MVWHSWQHDLDRWADPLAIEQAAAATGLPEERVFATTLASCEGALCDSHIHAGGVHWILSVKPFYRTRKWYGQQYCTACCVFRSMPGHDSGACRAGIPLDAGPRFRSMPAGVSEAG